MVEKNITIFEIGIKISFIAKSSCVEWYQEFDVFQTAVLRLVPVKA